MTQDNRQRLILAATLITLLVCFVILFRAKESEDNRIATTKQAVITSQATVDMAKSKYVAIKDRNIQKEKEVAKNAVQDLCKMYSDDGDALIGWAELVARARRYNGQWSDSTD